MIAEVKKMSEFEFVSRFLSASMDVRNQVVAYLEYNQYFSEPAQEPEDISDIKSRPVRDRHLIPSP